MSKRVIARKYLPTTAPSLLRLATIATILHYWQAPGWAWGIVGTISVIIFVVSWVVALNEKLVAPSEVEAK